MFIAGAVASQAVAVRQDPILVRRLRFVPAGYIAGAKPAGEDGG